MALRRPPTRIELKADDVEEYDKIMKERRIAIEQAALHDKLAQQQQTSTSTGDASIDNVDLATSTTTPSSFVSSRKKPSAAERIGYRKGSGGAR